LIDDEIHELALVTLRQILFSFFRSPHASNFSFTVDSMQVDDMYPGVAIPVVLFCNNDFFQSAIFFPTPTPVLTQINEVHLAMSPITAYLDGCFVSEVLFFFRSLFASVEPADPLTVSDSGPSAPIAIGRLTVDPLKLNFTLKWKTGRERRHPIDPALCLPFSAFQIRIPSITNATITIPKLLLGASSGPWSILSEQLTAHVVTSATDQWMSLLARVDATGLTGIEGSVRTVANRFRGTVETGRRSAGINRSARESVEDGFSDLVHGVREGIVGLVQKPIEGHHRAGTKGLMVGIGQGMSGLVGKPVSGVLDATAGVISGARKMITQGEVVHPVRIPRVFLLNRIRAFDLAPAQAQMMIVAGEDKAHGRSVFFFKYHTRKQVTGFASITTNWEIVIATPTKIRETYALKDIQEVRFDEQVLRLRVESGSLVMWLESAEVAESVKNVLDCLRDVALLIR
jgi:hypothetical protein